MWPEKLNHYLVLSMRIAASFFIAMVIFFLALALILQTQYGLPLLQKAIKNMTGAEFTAAQFEYDLKQPLTFHFDDLKLQSLSKQSHQIDKLHITLSAFESLRQQRIVLDSLWLKGATFKQDADALLPASIHIQDVALEKINYATDELSLNNMDLQLTNWQNTEGKLSQWQGDFLFAAEQVNYANEQLTDVLINGFHRANEWRIMTATMASDIGDISATARIKEKQIFFEQLAIDGTDNQQDKQIDLLQTALKPLLDNYFIRFSRLDLLDLHIGFGDLKTRHLNLTAHNLNLDKGQFTWQNEEKTNLSFNLASLSFRQWYLRDLLGDSIISADGIEISSLNGYLTDEGFFSVQGALTPHSINLDELVMSGVYAKFSEEEAEQLKHYFSTITEVAIDMATIKNASINLSQADLNMVLDGVNIQGYNIFIDLNKPSTSWKGILDISAVQADINDLVMQNLFVDISQDEKWQLNAQLPFAQGQLRFTTELDMTNPSYPWNIKGKGLGIPSSLYQRWFGLNLPLEGQHDVEFSLSGLGITDQSMRYSLSGGLIATLYNAKLAPDADKPLHSELADIFSIPALGAEPVAVHVETEQSPALPQTLAMTPETVETIATTKTDPEITDVAPAVAAPIVVPFTADKILLRVNRGRIELSDVFIRTPKESIRLNGGWDLVSRQGGFQRQ